jgi:hypothetical protein
MNKTSADILVALRRRYGVERDNVGPEWAMLEEFNPIGSNFGYRRCDLFLIRAWSGSKGSHGSTGNERIAIEIKVSRSDLLSELKKPEKSAPFEAVADKFYLAVPKGLIKDTDPIPETWGILEVSTSGTCRQVRKPTRNPNTEPMPLGGLVEAFRRASRAETRIRTATDEDPARIPELIKRLDSATQAEYRAKHAKDRATRALNDYMKAVADTGGWYCVCGLPMAKPNARGLAGWRRAHADGTTHCEAMAADTTRWGDHPEYDLERLAKQLGIDTDIVLPL